MTHFQRHPYGNSYEEPIQCMINPVIHPSIHQTTNSIQSCLFYPLVPYLQVVHGHDQLTDKVAHHLSGETAAVAWVAHRGGVQVLLQRPAGGVVEEKEGGVVLQERVVEADDERVGVQRF